MFWHLCFDMLQNAATLAPHPAVLLQGPQRAWVQAYVGEPLCRAPGNQQCDNCNPKHAFVPLGSNMPQEGRHVCQVVAWRTHSGRRCKHNSANPSRAPTHWRSDTSKQKNMLLPLCFRMLQHIAPPMAVLVQGPQRAPMQAHLGEPLSGAGASTMR